MNNNINYDVLLEYLSYIKIGSWQQFKKNVDDLNYDNQIINYIEIQKVFSRLGHIEFSFKNRGEYSVCPATICINKDGSEGILSGYRTKEFISFIKDKYEVIEIENYNAPKILIIKLKNGLDDFKKWFPQIRISKNFPEKVLNIMPTIEEVISNLDKMDSELEFSQSNVRLYKFNDKNNYIEKINSNKKADGLYERSNICNKDYFLCLNNNWYKIDKNWGIFYVNNLANKRIVQYRDNKIIINKYINFPELLDRALTMLSGKNPVITNNKSKIYENVDLNFAQKIAHIMGQKLEVING